MDSQTENNVVTQVHPRPVQTTNVASYQGQESMHPFTSQQSTPESTSISDNLPPTSNTNVNSPMAMANLQTQPQT